MSEKLRLGIDFGYGYTGIALLGPENKILDYKVIKHRSDLSQTLEGRRSNRAQRRRKLSKIRRLRDFYALLKGMGIEPKNAKPGQKSTWREKASVGNRLYALAHYRGWDYASLLEQLVSWTDEDKSPQCPQTVKEVDRILLQEFDAPAKFDERKKNKSESEDDYKKVRDEAEEEFNSGSRHSQVEKFSPKTISFIRIERDKTCLGELYKVAKDIHQLRKKLEKGEDVEEKLVEKEESYNELQSTLKDAKLEKIKSWIKKRLCFIYGQTRPNEEEIVLRIMTMLGLQTGEKLFEEGKIYRPHRNRHRKEMIDELKKYMEVACGLNKNDFQTILNDTFRRLEKSNFNKKKTILSKQEIERDWKKSIETVEQKAKNLAQTALSAEEIKRRWIKAAKKIVNRKYRKKRFENRSSMGKCPAKINGGERCKKNVAKKCKENIRELQFEIELRQ